jgi:predicted AlkP superfamily pyrophosphatase or phosphodiesterase
MTMHERLSHLLLVGVVALAPASCRQCEAPHEAPDSGVTSSAATLAVAPAQRPKPHAPFAVAIVVDQLSAWVAASRWPALPETGGFARLRREGTWTKNMRYPYAVTDTAPGHAALHTGTVPAESGIVGNELPDDAGGRSTILRDDDPRREHRALRADRL